MTTEYHINSLGESANHSPESLCQSGSRSINLSDWHWCCIHITAAWADSEGDGKVTLIGKACTHTQTHTHTQPSHSHRLSWGGGNKKDPYKQKTLTNIFLLIGFNTQNFSLNLIPLVREKSFQLEDCLSNIYLSSYGHHDSFCNHFTPNAARVVKWNTTVVWWRFSL